MAAQLPPRCILVLLVLSQYVAPESFNPSGHYWDQVKSFRALHRCPGAGYALVPHSSAFRTTQSEKLHPYSTKVKLNKLMEQGIINHMHFLDFEFTED